MKTTRRDFLRMGAAAGAGLYVSTKAGWMRVAGAAIAADGLSDPALQPKFANLVPDAMAPGFKFAPDRKGKIVVDIGPTTQYTGLVGTDTQKTPLPTDVFGYGQNGEYSWPGKTFEVQRDEKLKVRWHNELYDDDGSPTRHMLPVDTSLHWAYSLPGYEDYTLINEGIPIVPHLHGGHTQATSDGNPEYFFSPGFGVKGPRWTSEQYVYHNDQPAGALWYHDHALGITRLNVYAGLAGFYILRDEFDTGMPDNPLGLPAWPYEKAYAIQDRMFKDTGDLFYPANPGDPFYDDFITDEEAVLPSDIFPGGGPTALAEFFGDHMVVNGLIWPKENVEPRNYRMRLLNGTDSRFMALRFRVASHPIAEDLIGAGDPLPYWVIGSDQGLSTQAIQTDLLISEPGSRYDVVFDFSQVDLGSRVIMENIGGDAPFGGDFGDDLDPAEDFFPNRQTDRIMAFDVVELLSGTADGFNAHSAGVFTKNQRPVDNVRQVALFEGKDEYGRLQPLLGANTGTAANPIWSAIAWHSPTTENPDLGATEEWEIYNFTGDAHPVHLHLVHFDVLGRNAITFSSDDGEPGQEVHQHNGETGVAPRITDVVVGDPINLGSLDGYVENAPKDMVTALPDQVTRIKATFDRPGRYVWHCHILSHEDHEMMRVLHVGPGA